MQGKGFEQFGHELTSCANAAILDAFQEVIKKAELVTLRIALFLTLGYYGLQFVLGLSKEVFPISFVKMYIFNMCIVGLALFYRLNVEREEYLILAFWLAFLFIINIATTNRYRKLFKK